jgi:hypothetical protein
MIKIILSFAAIIFVFLSASIACAGENSYGPGIIKGVDDGYKIVNSSGTRGLAEVVDKAQSKFNSDSNEQNLGYLFRLICVGTSVEDSIEKSGQANGNYKRIFPPTRLDKTMGPAIDRLHIGVQDRSSVAKSYINICITQSKKVLDVK